MFDKVLFDKLVVVTRKFLIEMGLFGARSSILLQEYLESQTPVEPPTEPVEPVEPVEPPTEPVEPVEPPVEPPAAPPYVERSYPPQDGAREVYVSSSTGNDNSVGNADFPVKSISRGLSLLRSGKPDRLLFKRGDIWTNEGFDNIELSGESAEAPMVFGSYGDLSLPRPLFDTGKDSGLNTFPKGSPPREPLSLDYLVFVGLHFYASERDPNNTKFTNVESKPTGFRFLRSTKGLTIDDCKFEYYHTNIIIQDYAGAGSSNVVITNSCIFNAYAYAPEAGHSQGIFVDKVHGLEISNCILDYNGYNLDAPNSEPTIYNHNTYIQKTCTNVLFRDNILSRASSHGCQIRPGGLVKSNFFYRNPINLLVGYEDPNIIADVVDNVIAEGTNISPELPRVWGIEFKNQNPPNVVLSRNIVANSRDTSPNSRSIEDRSNVTYVDNITHAWPPNGRFNDISAMYKNPNVDIEDAGFTTEGFYDAMRAHSMDSPTLSAYQFLEVWVGAFTEV